MRSFTSTRTDSASWRTNRIHNALRAVGERANALLKVTFQLLRNITIDPWKIGLVAKAALAILHTEYRRTA
ncbi:hypothetical protein BCD48_40610 [Pseudofrankia sp. BMG5.36]|nr:hypothetical protein BCD48_40610 [Pseudofrankia sp. BMG5.36]